MEIQIQDKETGHGNRGTVYPSSTVVLPIRVELLDGITYTGVEIGTGFSRVPSADIVTTVPQPYNQHTGE